MVENLNENARSAESEDVINYESPLDYIRDLPNCIAKLPNGKYIASTNSEYSKLSDENQKNMDDLSKKGTAAYNEIKKIMTCQQDFNLVRAEDSNGNKVKLQWQNSGTVFKYLWGQMKYQEYQNNPISISLFVDESSKQGDANYRVSLEIKNDAEKSQKEKYHRYLDLVDRSRDEQNGLLFALGSNDIDESVKILPPEDQNPDTIKKLIEEGNKVQYCKIIERGADYEKEIKSGIEALIPFYRYVLGISDVKTKANTEAKADMGTNFPKNLILYGPPGTGKTYSTVTYAVAICNVERGSLEDYEKLPYEELLKQYKELKEEGRIAFTTFHQSYGYEEFIEGIKPVLKEQERESSNYGTQEEQANAPVLSWHQENDSVGYRIEPGVFKKFCDNAKKQKVEDVITLARNENPLLADTKILPKENPCVFIIDEINRGNISKIFGELITLIEDTKRAGADEAMDAILPYSGEPFSVPQNVYILGTMNTADRSIALMDTALRRRFDFIEMQPDCDKLKVDGEPITIKDSQGHVLDIVAMLEKINERIEVLFDREHTIGHAFFMKLRDMDNRNIVVLKDIFRKKVVPLLQEYFYENYEFIQLVLGDNAKPDDLKFIKDMEVKAETVFKNNKTAKENSATIDNLPEKIYTINDDAFDELESYIQIYK